MPQAADAGDPTGLTKTPPEAAAGAINYLDPLPDDAEGEEVQAESRRTDSEVIIERWQKMAGLLKDYTSY